MSQTTEVREDPAASILTAEPTPLTRLLGLGKDAGLVASSGARTPAVFSDAANELSALLTDVAAFDGGARVRLRVTGEDRVRWLNGMVTNTVKALVPATHNYTFILNAQGRIQGDATVFAFADHLLLETDRAQAERLFAHLDRFIIMDDVELSWADGQTTIGLAGPNAETLLTNLGLPAPASGSFSLANGRVIVGESGGHGRRFSLWVAEQESLNLWQQLLAAGATAAGATALDALRVLEGTPLYRVDISEKTLAQETGQMRALNFNKGCYLGQEIVERVRARANVHRGIRQFALHGQAAVAGALLTSGGAVVGELTSVAHVSLAGQWRQLALGSVRIEALAHPLYYPGGEAEALSRSPLSAAGKEDI